MGLLLYHFPEVLDGSDSGLNLDASYNAGLNKMFCWLSDQSVLLFLNLT